MGGVSIWHWLVVGVIVLLLFGRGKISEMMGDVAKGIKAFKKGMSEEEAAAATTAGGDDPGRSGAHDRAPGAGAGAADDRRRPGRRAQGRLSAARLPSAAAPRTARGVEDRPCST